MLLVSSNRNYPPIRWEEKKWIHVGIVVYAMRDMMKRYAGQDEE
jgi:hypothetical protein